MALRTRLLTLPVTFAILCLALLGAACGDDSGGGGGGSSEEARALLERAYKNQITSADITFDASAELDGVEELKGPLKLKLDGPIQQDSPTDFPVLDLDITAEGAGKSFAANVTATESNAFVEYEGQAYEVGRDAFRQFKEQTEAQSQSFTPQGLRALGFDPTGWLRDASVEDGEEIGGDPTRLVTGDVDVEAVIRDVFELLRSPAVQQQLEQQGPLAPQIPEPTDEDIEKIAMAIDNLTFEVNVDENDVARRSLIEGDFTLPEGTDAGGLEGGSVRLEFVANEVDVDPQIDPPSDTRPISGLIEKLGLGGVVGGDQGPISPQPGAPTPGAPPGGLQTP